MDTLTSAQRHGGLPSLYRGFGVSAAAIGAYKALYFGLYDTACAVMEQVGRAWPGGLGLCGAPGLPSASSGTPAAVRPCWLPYAGLRTATISSPALSR
jgi:hypothetical protein